LGVDLTQDEHIAAIWFSGRFTSECDVNSDVNICVSNSFLKITFLIAEWKIFVDKIDDNDC